MALVERTFFEQEVVVVESEYLLPNLIQCQNSLVQIDVSKKTKDNAGI